MRPTTVPVTTDRGELARVYGALGEKPFRNNQRFAIGLGLLSGTIWLTIGVTRLLDLQARTHFGFIAYFDIGLGVLNLVQGALAIRRYRSGIRTVASTDTEVTIADTGLTLLPSTRSVSWKSITEVRDVGDYFAFVTPNRVSYATIPKKELANDGRDLWAALDDLLVPKRYLIRDGLSSRRISVTPEATLASDIETARS